MYKIEEVRGKGMHTHTCEQKEGNTRTWSDRALYRTDTVSRSAREVASISSRRWTSVCRKRVSS